MTLLALGFVVENYFSLIFLICIGTIIFMNKNLNIPAVGIIGSYSDRCSVS